MDESVEVEEEVVIEDVPVEPPTTETKPLDGGSAAAPASDAPATKERTIDDIPSEADGGIAAIPVIKNTNDDPVVTRLSFNDIDNVLNDDGTTSAENAPKDIERLEEISTANFMQRKLEEAAEDDSSEKIKILSDEVSMDDLGIQEIGSGGASATTSMDDAIDLFDDILTLA